MSANGHIQPFKYQQEDILSIEKFNGRVLLAEEPGLGKTITSLLTLKRNPEWFPALVICPASLKYQWEYETFRALGIRASVCEGQTPPRKGGFGSKPQIVIINYDILRFWKAYLLGLEFHTVIADESQYTLNPKAQRTKAVREIASRVSHMFALSGTPLLNRPIELYPIVNMLWPREFSDWWSFAQEFCAPKMSRWGWDFSGSSNLPELREKLLKAGMIRRRKKDVLKDLPDKIRSIIPCKLSDPKEYQYASTHFRSWMKLNHSSRMRKALKSEALVKLGYLLRLCTKLKLKFIVDETNDFLKYNTGKIVLFAIHTKAIDVLKRRTNYPSVVIDGSVSGRKRQIAIDQFQNDKRVRVLIGQHQAAGVGLNLTAASRVGIVEFGWRPGDLVQLEDRIHRIGQREKSMIFYYPALGTIEEKLCRMLQDKQEVLTSVLDGEGNADDINLWDLLLQEMEKTNERN